MSASYDTCHSRGESHDSDIKELTSTNATWYKLRGLSERESLQDCLISTVPESSQLTIPRRAYLALSMMCKMQLNACCYLLPPPLRIVRRMRIDLAQQVGTGCTYQLYLEMIGQSQRTPQPYAGRVEHGTFMNIKMPNTVQTLDARYIDGEKLLALLKGLFGAGNFKINVRPLSRFPPPPPFLPPLLPGWHIFVHHIEPWLTLSWAKACRRLVHPLNSSETYKSMCEDVSSGRM